jgi:hypothetical protein
MASSNKPTAVHFWLILTSMTTLGLAISTYFGFKGKSEEAAKAAAASAEATSANGNLATAQGDLAKALQLLGTDPASYVAAEEGMRKAMTSLGKNHEKQTVLATLEAMRAGMDSLDKDLIQSRKNEQDLKTQILNLRSESRRSSMRRITPSRNPSNSSSRLRRSRTRLSRSATRRSHSSRKTFSASRSTRSRFARRPTRWKRNSTPRLLR